MTISEQSYLHHNMQPSTQYHSSHHQIQDKQQIPSNAQPDARAILECNYAENTKEFQQYNTLQRSLKQKIIKTFDALWLQGLEDDVLAFTNATDSTTNDGIIVQLLWRDNAKKLVDNKNILSEPFNPAQPIETFFQTIKNTVDYADAGHAPFGANQIIAQTYTHLFISGVLVDACERWNTLPLAKIGPPSKITSRGYTKSTNSRKAPPQDLGTMQQRTQERTTSFNRTQCSQSPPWQMQQ
jgi:hypothetical protein